MNWDIVAFKRKPVTLTCTDKEKKILSNLCQRVEKLGGKRNSWALYPTHTVRYRPYNLPHVKIDIVKFYFVCSFAGIFLSSEDVDMISYESYPCQRSWYAQISYVCPGVILYVKSLTRAVRRVQIILGSPYYVKVSPNSYSACVCSTDLHGCGHGPGVCSGIIFFNRAQVLERVIGIIVFCFSTDGVKVFIRYYTWTTSVWCHWGDRFPDVRVRIVPSKKKWSLFTSVFHRSTTFFTHDLANNNQYPDYKTQHFRLPQNSVKRSSSVPATYCV